MTAKGRSWSLRMESNAIITRSSKKLKIEWNIF